MKFDFDKIIPRKTTGCIKYDRRPELLPFWVADMDFESAPEILEALHARVDHGVFGYAQAHAGVNEAVLNYLKTRRHAEVPMEHIVHLGGLVPALSLSARAFCKAGDSLMTCTPAYPPFLGVHHDAKVGLITVDHVLEDGKWTFDWEAMEEAVTPETKLFLLCNPQNPLGRVFTAEEVEKVARFCVKHDMVLVSDEIHCDLVYDESSTPHFSAVNLPAELQKNTITLLAPSKTWNIAGLAFAFAVIPDDTIRRKFTATRGHTLSEINVFAYYAGEAAYKYGEPWRLELVAYLKENRDTLVDFINNQCPGLSILEPEATYLAWIDARELGQENPAKFFEDEAGLFLQDGALFGWPGRVRFNFGCPKSVMMEGLEKMKAACLKLEPASVH
ncbi:PatB family C-S lyase [Luteolibacter pohnpeiensis]|uniref:cysteine-S-conjugate beta-lyase n=1 Tax=Luteolibacter pohnpeiensis TaxID=454153 RepID=A0A934S5J5_9BACT|nr:PatB family C-S lyase [Luteolibacter pohnpeiensis]MBK1881655.1 PatB family C-S lyase [Luteolibacter pohnpeiensis]